VNLKSDYKKSTFTPNSEHPVYISALHPVRFFLIPGYKRAII